MTDQAPQKSNKPIFWAISGLACVLAWQTYTGNAARECQGFIGQQNVYDTVIAAQWTFSKGCEVTTVRNLSVIGDDPGKTEIMSGEMFKRFRDRHIATGAI